MEILENIFYCFWYVLGDFWVFYCAGIISLALVALFIYMMTKR